MSRVLVTGGTGFLGTSVVAGLAASDAIECVVSADIRTPGPGVRLPGVLYERLDVTDAAGLPALLRRHQIDTVVHLASIVNPGKSTTVSQEFAVDVEGSRAVFDACVEAGVSRIVVSSSGAAYGYHRENAEWITEGDPLRGNDDFPYSRHKRLVEEMLAELRETAPQLTQTVFRIGTILGPAVDNQITALWETRRVLKLAGSDSPFVFVWVDDVVEVMVRAASGGPAGIFNVAGNGKMTVREIAAALGKRLIIIPPWLFSVVLTVGHALKLTPHKRAQVNFLLYRPVLDNGALKSTFGFTPRKSSREAFSAYLEAKALR
ncbi:NAD-dependent epimerase/dehydratase family protein [Salinibacterium sp. NSLL150]|uniref:NAD-dependent epimerase/dehydratase family protein n=1 Tax=unclassified Salinibacterium TaxID=2632331 RepID=UPI0018CD5CC9|nr:MULTISPECIES: NAD-dependent epimerase/dehydratase family protein [unclassified Salinibacterium]MBH0099697.1 NAD-dependent epimerase/dehydratase family protein [Salinibacterium sp. NSLL35]MBH0102451.1 NAD-dependent epimerase/dehydratase family protein [Salinibacterium sp. NSLL150]MBH0105211.1 NAD-dependent epimerase/dehydratase family protein [Salinibacterium sp. NSLL16]MBH0107971.1 NAD-dependent epimerase/dehydratase family protein [Salinibacterium sp. NSLL17]